MLRRVAALSERRLEPCAAFQSTRDRPHVHCRVACARTAVRDSRRGGRRRRDGHRSVDHRHCVLGADRPVRLSALRVVAFAAHARRCRDVVGRDHFHHRLRDGDGVGAHAIGLFAGPRRVDDVVAGRLVGLPRAVDRRVHRARQRARRHSRHCAVRPAAVPHRARRRRQRSALRDRRDSFDGRGPLLAAVRRRLLLGMRGEPHQSRRGHAADHRLYERTRARADSRRVRSVDIDRFPLGATSFLSAFTQFFTIPSSYWECLHESFFWRDSPGRLRRARYRSGDGSLEPRARRWSVVL
ncbi:hypothetical protein PSAB6_10144 [Paraburkholderia sabiae]|nr:hypothetical protein PSAB6_10144 [Paraburkholderia sabiae]